MARIKGCAMGQVLHGSATTTEAIRRAIQHSKESLRALSRRYGINQKTVRKWKARSSVVDRRTGPKEPRSWINHVERWFAELTRKQLRRGVHTSTKQLEADIRAFIARHNEKPKPYRWTKSADDILASVKRFCQKTQQTLCSEL